MTALTLPADRLLGMLRNYPREAVSAAFLGLAALAAIVAAANPAASLPRLPVARDVTAPPPVEPMMIRDIAPQKAEQINAAIPLDSGPNPAARPFLLGHIDPVTRERATDCLAQAVYFEAASENQDGQRAVAQVVLNRLRHPAFPKSVCGVVYQGSDRSTGCQFTFTCDGSLDRAPIRWAWDRARKVAEAALAGYVYAPVGEATHYHTDWVVPYWSSSLTKSAIVGAHIFYRWAGGWGTPAAFTGHYARSEPDAGALRNAAQEARNQAGAADPGSGLAQAKKDLPPELAALVNAEPGMAGKRVEMKLGVARKSDAATADGLAKLDAAMKDSASLRWALGGENTGDQAPLGRAKADGPQPAPSLAPAAGASGGK